jgi:adenine-specific DNA-methyltransferase
MMTPAYQNAERGVSMFLGDCLDVMPGLADNSVDCIATDPPYFKVKGEAWDRQWDTPCKFLEWLDGCVEQWARLLKPNGSLYCFASPKMSARVEVQIGARLNVLNRIIWRKQDGTQNEGGLWSRANKDILRRYFEQAEHVIFAEHYGADNIAKGEAGYGAKCDELRGFVFEPLRAYLAGERDRAGWTTRRVAEQFQKKSGSRTVTGMAGHWFECAQWTLPTEENYDWLRSLFNVNGTQYLRREYEGLRREYEDLRRPFFVTPDVPYTDVWDFKTVAHYLDKHPCEKPVAMMEHVVTTSTRPGAVVLDCFMGSGTTGIACLNAGRKFVGVEKDPAYFAIAVARIEAAIRGGVQMEIGT